MYEHERWVPSLWNPNKYLVSDYGRVKRMCKNGKEIIYEPHKANNGYMRTTTGIDRDYTHRIVAKHFIPNPNNLPQVNHIDGNKKNNYYTNLEWCTGLQNAQHASAHGLINRDSEKRKKAIKINRIKAVENSKKPIVCLDLSGKIINIFPSASDAARCLGKPSCSSITTVASKAESQLAHKLIYGFQWVYLEDYDSSKDYTYVPQNHEPAKKPVFMCDENMEPIKRFSSQKEANDYLGLYNKSSYIGECCNGKKKESRRI